MDFFGTVGAVLAANLLTAVFVWAMVQFHRHDYQAPWTAYFWAFFVLLYAAGSLYVSSTYQADVSLLH